MSVFTPINTYMDRPKVRNSQYIRTENKPDDAETKPEEPTTPEQPEAN